MSTILFGSSENLKIPGKIIIERKNLELGFDHGKDAGEEIVKRLGELVAIRLQIVLLGHFGSPVCARRNSESIGN